MGVLIPRGRGGRVGNLEGVERGAGLPPHADREGSPTRAPGVNPAESGGMSESSHLASEGHGCREASIHWHGGDTSASRGLTSDGADVGKQNPMWPAKTLTIPRVFGA
jgi:hypothetical protein